MKSLIVSIHDVSPQTSGLVREILKDLRALGIPQTSLLVIPNHHHRGHFLADPAFCVWLQEMEKEGHEIVTHGYFHQREATVNESTRDKMITRFYTAGEGEFYDISEADAVEKMSRAQAEFAKIGLQPVGFIAPAWLLSPAAAVAAEKTGFRYTTTLREIRPLADSHFHGSQSLVYSVRSPWRRACSLAWNGFLVRRLTANPVIRLGIHPPDWKYADIRRQILSISQRLAQSRRPTTYAQWTQS